VKIALVSAHFSPHIGGVETHVEKLARDHSAAGHEVTVITQSANKTADDFPFEVVRLASRVRNEAFPLGGGVNRAIASGGFDVVHVHNYHTALFAQAGRTDAAPLVVTPHFHGTSEFTLGRAAHVVWSRANASTWRHARQIIAVAEQEAVLLQRRFPSLAGRVQVIPNGVDVPADLAPVDGNNSQPIVLTVGRLERHKRIDRVIAAIAHVPHAKLVVIGSGPLRQELTAQADRIGVGSRVEFRGRVTETELWTAYQSADVFCTLSEIEAFGLTLAEAMTAGTPVVASNIAAHKEVVAIASDVPATLVDTAVSHTGIGAALTDALGDTRQPLQPRFAKWAEVAESVRSTYEAAIANAHKSGAS
jgi:glycosyltransferase involved in cell wall biosynthesis